MIDGDSEVKRIHGQFQINLEGFSAVTKFGNLGRIPNPERKKTTRLEARDYKTRNGFEWIQVDFEGIISYSKYQWERDTDADEA